LRVRLGDDRMHEAERSSRCGQLVGDDEAALIDDGDRQHHEREGGAQGAPRSRRHIEARADGGEAGHGDRCALGDAAPARH
jgi:hypothetical protein